MNNFTGQSVPRNLNLSNATKTFTGVGDNVGNPQLIAYWEVPANTRWELLDGESIVAEIVDENGDEIDGSSILIFGGLDVNQRVMTELAQHEYGPHEILTVAQQSSDEYKEKLRLRIPGGGRAFGPRKRIALALETVTEKVDPSASVVSFRVRETKEA